MRAVYFAVLIFLINISISLVNDLGVFTTHMQPQQELLDQQNASEWQTEQYYQSGVQSTTTISLGFGDIARGFYYFMKAIVMATFGVPYLYMAFGLNAALAVLLSLITWLIYGIGIVQFSRGTGFKQMD